MHGCIANFLSSSFSETSASLSKESPKLFATTWNRSFSATSSFVFAWIRSVTSRMMADLQSLQSSESGSISSHFPLTMTRFIRYSVTSLMSAW